VTHRAPGGRPRPSARRQVTHATAPFSLVDELSCYYDTPAEPNNVHLELRCTATPDDRALRAAVAGALDAMPQARGRRASGGWLRRSYSWEYPARLDAEPVATASWADEQDLDRLRTHFLATSPSLDTSPPVRLLLASGPSGASCLLLKAHHAALDGVSCLALLRDIGARYAAAAAIRPGSSGSADNQAHAALGQLAATLPASDLVTGLDRADPVGPAATASRTPGGKHRAWRPARIARSRAAGPARQHGGYGVLVLPLRPVPPVSASVVWPTGTTLAAKVTTGAEPTATHPSAGPVLARPTLNDVLITALAVTIADWNAEHAKRERAIKITMPVNARGPDQQQAAGNLSRLVTVTSWPASTTAPELLADVTRQTRLGRSQPGPQVGGGLRRLAGACCPVGIKRLLVRAALSTVGPVICDTAMLTNLGNVVDPPRLGTDTCTAMAFSTSAHMPRGLSVAAITVGGQLQLALRYRYALLDQAAAARFAASLEANLTGLTSVPNGIPATELIRSDRK
jgi:NRPS condensation-like uncharacterized protein